MPNLRIAVCMLLALVAFAGNSLLCRAAVQLSASILAAAGGVFFLGESLTLRLLVASLAIIGDIALVVLTGKARETAA
jgi:hypothetical protein